mmetsp:Transcript_53047/g.103792  ORF Transcript_53047/g.103792 Transcript_53047/m.103792 type:complete len:178 (-) Transcript_53047:22-555(-)
MSIHREIHFPPEYGYIILEACVSVFMLTFLSLQVTMARKRYGVEYPEMYAVKGVTRTWKGSGISTDEQSLLPIPDSDCDAFNCYQRSHQNTLENYPQFLFLLTIGGIRHPVVCAVAGALWMIGRLLYAVGYQTGHPKKRQWGLIAYVGLLTLIIVNIKFAFELLMTRAITFEIRSAD